MHETSRLLVRKIPIEKSLTNIANVVKISSFIYGPQFHSNYPINYYVLYKACICKYNRMTTQACQKDIHL